MKFLVSDGSSLEVKAFDEAYGRNNRVFYILTLDDTQDYSPYFLQSLFTDDNLSDCELVRSGGDIHFPSLTLSHFNYHYLDDSLELAAIMYSEDYDEQRSLQCPFSLTTLNRLILI